MNPIKIGDILLLAPKTRHGKNKIEQHGASWKIIAIREDNFVLESLNKTFNPLPGLKGGDKETDNRQVKKVDDINFDIISISEQ